MSLPTTTRTGHRELDLPTFEGARYHIADTLVIVWLFKATSPDRKAVQHIITEVGSIYSPENKDHPVGTVPWLRSFESTAQDIGDMTFTNCILIDKNLLEQNKCIICHGLTRSITQFGIPTMEYATVKLTEAYDLVTRAKWNKSWFPDPLSVAAKLDFPCSFTSCRPAAPQIADLPPYDSEVAIFVVVELTPKQHAQLLEMLDHESAAAVLIDLHNTAPDKDDIDFLMEDFLKRKWFPGDFAVIDAQTVMELDAINANRAAIESDSKIEVNQHGQQETYPSFLLATSLQLNHRATDSQRVGLDEVGYAVGRRQMDDEDEYSLWCGCVFRGMGLRSIIGDEGYERYYWSCWLNEKGRVDAEVKSEADIRY